MISPKINRIRLSSARVNAENAGLCIIVSRSATGLVLEERDLIDRGKIRHSLWLVQRSTGCTAPQSSPAAICNRLANGII